MGHGCEVGVGCEPHEGGMTWDGADPAQRGDGGSPCAGSSHGPGLAHAWQPPAVEKAGC